MPSPAPPSARRPVLPLVLAAAVFLLALGPRLWRIDAHLTPDELRWVCRTVGFHTGLATGDLGLTLQTGHPGVVTMWLGGLGLPTAPEAAWSRACLDSKSSELLYELPAGDRRVILERLYAGRRRIALATALMAAVIAWLAGRLFGRRTAVVAAPLIALDPFWLAHSRFLHLDGVLTGLMTIALLTLLVHLVGPVDDAAAATGPLPRWRWLVASGVALGLALAAKSPALFVIGYGGVLWLALARRRRTGLRAMVGEGLLWLAAAALTLVAVWPALWAEPVAVVRLVATEFASHGTATLERASFFAGEIRDDAGPLFYATVWWLRTSPWALAGAAIAAWSVGGEIVGRRRWRRRAALGTVGGASTTRAPIPSDRMALRCLFGFVVLFTLFLTAASKEFDRYLLPAFPAADIVAAVGLVGAVDWAMRRRAAGAAGLGERAKHAAHASPLPAGNSTTTGNPTTMAAMAPTSAVATALVVLATQLALVIPIAPYWITWYDPLVGGAERAQRLMLVGWGEGLDQMAAFLNAQPGAEKLEVASRYRAAFGLLFDGRNVQTDDYDPDTTDYIVVMLNQVQRHQDPELLAKYMGVDPPAAAADIGGITLAWASRNRADEPLRAYLDAHADPATDALVVREGHILTRRYAGPLEVVALPDDTSEEAAAAARGEPLGRRLADVFARHRRVWYVHRAEGRRSAPDLDASRLLATSTRPMGSERLGDLVVESFEAPAGSPPTFARPPAQPVDVRFSAQPGAELRLAALGLPPAPWPADRWAAVDLTWRTTGPGLPPITVSVQLLDAAGKQRAQLDEKLVDAAGDPSDEWPADIEAITPLALDVRGLPAGEYTLSIGAYTAKEDGNGWRGLGVQAGADVGGLASAGAGARIQANRLLVPVRLVGP